MAFGAVLLRLPRRQTRHANRDITDPQKTGHARTQGCQSGTCAPDRRTGPCTKTAARRTPETVLHTAAGHPPSASPSTSSSTNRCPTSQSCAEPAIIGLPRTRTIKTLRVDLPPGLTVNPEATPQLPARPIPQRSRREPSSRCMRPQRRAKTAHLVTNRGEVTPNACPKSRPGKCLQCARRRCRSTTSSRFDGEPAIFGFVDHRQRCRSSSNRSRLGERLPRELHDQADVDPPEPTGSRP